MDLLIRAAIQSDLDSVLAIEQASPTAAHWSRGQYEAAISNNEKFFLVAELEGLIIGFLLASAAVQEWELENIAVLPSARGRGIGKGLMQKLQSLAGEAGATEIRQEIRASNLAAQRLGQQVGFIQDGHRPGYYRHPQEDALLFKYLVRSKPELTENPPSNSEKSGKNR